MLSLSMKFKEEACSNNNTLTETEHPAVTSPETWRMVLSSYDVARLASISRDPGEKDTDEPKLN